LIQVKKLTADLAIGNLVKWGRRGRDVSQVRSRKANASREDKMFGFQRLIRQGAAALAFAVMLTGTITASQAGTGTVRFVVTKVGFIVGVGGGNGTLHFNGKSYRLHINGVSAGTIGIATADLAGTASNLNTAADIAGGYTAVSGSIAFAGGGKGVQLQNAKGVLLNLHGVQAGFELSLSLSGVTISFR
jgi:hypothetical protein